MSTIIYPGTALPSNVQAGKKFSSGQYYNADGTLPFYPGAPNGVVPFFEGWKVLPLPTSPAISSTHWIRVLGKRILLIASNGNTMYHSDDFGQNWVLTNLPASGNTGELKELGIGAWFLSRVASGTAFISTNYGNTWSTVSAGGTHRYITSIAYAGLKAVACGAGGTSGTPSVIVSSNGGISWSRVTSAFSTSNTFFKVLETMNNFIILNSSATFGPETIMVSFDGSNFSSFVDGLTNVARDGFSIAGRVVLVLVRPNTDALTLAYCSDGGFSWDTISFSQSLYRSSAPLWVQQGEMLYGMTTPAEAQTQQNITIINMRTLTASHYRMPSNSYYSRIIVSSGGSRIVALRLTGSIHDISEDGGVSWKSVDFGGMYFNSSLAEGDGFVFNTHYTDGATQVLYSRWQVN